jgi:hypothetical protein
MRNCPCMAQPDLVRRLIAAGCPLDIKQGVLDKPDTPPRGLLIHQVGGVFETKAFDLNCSGTGYILDLEIASNVPGLVAIRYFTFELPWQDPRFCWLPDPADSRTEKHPYVFPGTNGLEYPREVVINHRTSGRGRLRRGEILDGLLLGMGFESIPDSFRHGGMVDTTLCIVDQFGRRFSSKISLWVDRSRKLHPRPPKRPRRRLFQRVDSETVEEPTTLSR